MKGECILNNLNNIIKEIEDKRLEGIIRRIDELGRMVIPIDYRMDNLNDKVTLYLNVISKYVILSKENENQSGMARMVDEIGRVTIKLETRKKLSWEEKDYIEIWYYNGYIVMKKVENKCVFCNRDKSLENYMGKMICKKCKNNLTKV